MDSGLTALEECLSLLGSEDDGSGEADVKGELGAEVAAKETAYDHGIIALGLASCLAYYTLQDR